MAEDDDSFWRSPTSQELLQQFLNLLGAETEWVCEQVTESSRHGQYLHPASQCLVQDKQKQANEELSFLWVLTLLLTQNL